MLQHDAQEDPAGGQGSKVNVAATMYPTQATIVRQPGTYLAPSED